MGLIGGRNTVVFFSSFLLRFFLFLGHRVRRVFFVLFFVFSLLKKPAVGWTHTSFLTGAGVPLKPTVACLLIGTNHFELVWDNVRSTKKVQQGYKADRQDYGIPTGKTVSHIGQIMILSLIHI